MDLPNSRQTDELTSALWSKISYHILCAFHSNLDEYWTDNDQQRTFVNRIYWPTYGRASVIIDNREIVIEPGFLYLIPTNCILELKAEQRFGKYWCHFYTPTFNGFDLFELIDVPIKIKPPHPEQTDQHFKQLATLSQVPQSGCLNIQRIVHLIHLLEPIFEAVDLHSTQSDKAAFSPVLQHIQNNIDQTIKLEDLANLLNMSPNHFIRCFRTAFHCTPIQYLLIKRIQFAERMLCLSSKTLQEIAYLCGFNSSSRFSKTFKKLTSRSPRQFRDSFKSKTPPTEALQSQPNQPSFYPEQLTGSPGQAARLTRGWLRSELDWLYCNVRFKALSAGVNEHLDQSWSGPANTVQHNMLLFPTAGEGIISVDQVNTAMHPGKLYLIPIGSALTLRGGANLTLHKCIFTARQPEAADLFESIKASFAITSDDAAATTNLFKQLESTFQSEELLHNNAKRTALLLELLIPFLQSAVEQPRDHIAFMPALLYMRDNLHRNISLDELAATMGQSTEHFARSFRDALKVPPMHYLQEERINRSKKLLTGTALTAQEIGEQCGFNTPSHFAKTFKKHIGITPGQFRKQNSTDRII